MNCKKVKELILTDYLDGQMDKEQETLIDNHLADCVDCMEYKLIVRKTAFSPFSNPERHKPPDALWHKIKEQIEEEQQESTSPFADLIRKIGRLMYVPRPVFAVAAVAIILLITVTILKLPSRSQEIVEVTPEKQIECVNYLISVFDQDSTDEDDDFETFVDEYFL